MKKAVLTLSCIATSLLATQEYTHEVEFTVKFKTSPTSQEQRKEIEAHFASFMDITRSPEHENKDVALMREIEKALTEIPAYCKKHNVAGSVGMNLSMKCSENDCETN